VAGWLETYVHPRPHRVTGEAPAVRLSSEAALLGPLPRVRFDTARREARVVSAPFPFVEVDRVPYSVPPELVGVTVEVRLPVDTATLEVFHWGEIVATHRLGVPGTGPAWTRRTRPLRKPWPWPPTAVASTPSPSLRRLFRADHPGQGPTRVARHPTSTGSTAVWPCPTGIA
jgi:hypothetical protein